MALAFILGLSAVASAASFAAAVVATSRDERDRSRKLRKVAGSFGAVLIAAAAVAFLQLRADAPQTNADTSTMPGKTETSTAPAGVAPPTSEASDTTVTRTATETNKEQLQRADSDGQRNVALPPCALDTIFMLSRSGEERSVLMSDGRIIGLLDEYLHDAKRRGISIDLASLRIFYFRTHGTKVASFRARDFIKGGWAKRTPRQVIEWYFGDAWGEEVADAETAAKQLNADVICGD